MTTNGTNGTGNPLDSAAAALEHEWATNPRWAGVQRNYSAADVLKLRPSLLPESTIARYGAERLWNAMQDTDFVRTF
ncbi:MAG: isocitrate lyase, partial [Chloroflexota bacterium]|nr:isocitrate lyase [Chloroflexota bacterium]